MEYLRNIPALLRDHYEKVILGLALLALGLAGLLLANEKAKEEEALKAFATKLIARKPIRYIPTDMKPYLVSLEKGTNPVSVNFTPPHKLFNPVNWYRQPDGNLLKAVKGNEVGVDAMVVTKITPLHFQLNWEKMPGETDTSFYIGVVREASTNLSYRKKSLAYVSAGSPKERTGSYAFKEIKGMPDKPEVTLELLDTNERVTLTKEAPVFQRVDGYKVDLSYPPEKKTFPEKRLNDFIILAGETNSIIAIAADEVILLNQSNNKRTPLKYNAAP
jgi:hypothetical protein